MEAVFLRDQLISFQEDVADLVILMLLCFVFLFLKKDNLKEKSRPLQTFQFSHFIGMFQL